MEAGTEKIWDRFFVFDDHIGKHSLLLLFSFQINLKLMRLKSTFETFLFLPQLETIIF